MSLIKKELTEKNGYVLEFSVDKEIYRQAELAAYKKNVKSINVPGFRRGKAPMHIIKTMYGKDVFFEDAINECIPEAFEAAVKEAGLEIVGSPKFDLVSMDGDIVLKAEGFVKPEATVEGYKGIEAPKKVKRVLKADVEAELAKVLDRNARFVTESEDAVKDGDTVTIDFEGFVDGEAFEGGKGTDHELKLGSGSFIPGFEAQIAGHKLGDEFDVNVTFPEDYHAKELAGKPAVFKVTIHKLSAVELPALDDDFAKDVSEFDTFDEYKADLKAKIEKRHETSADSDVDEQLSVALMEKLEADIPECMFETETENFVRDYDNRLRMQGLDLKTYFQYTGMTLETLREQMRPQAERQVKLRLALEKIAALEALEATEEDINSEYENIANSYNVPVDQVKASIDAAAIAEDMKVKKAMDLVKETAKITKPRKPAAKKKAAEAEAETAQTVETENTEA